MSNWTTVCGYHVMVIDGIASWAINKQTGRYAEIKVDGKEAGGKITVRKLREMIEAGRAIIK